MNTNNQSVNTYWLMRTFEGCFCNDLTNEAAKVHIGAYTSDKSLEHIQKSSIQN